MPVGARRPRPELFPDLAPVWSAFAFASMRRQRGPHGVQPLTAVEIATTAEIFGASDSATRREWCCLLAALDACFMAHADEETAKARERARKR